jgi:ribosome-binding ATPase YchF (GTP1/OBG family)
MVGKEEINRIKAKIETALADIKDKYLPIEDYQVLLTFEDLTNCKISEVFYDTGKTTKLRNGVTIKRPSIETWTVKCFDLKLTIKLKDMTRVETNHREFIANYSLAEIEITD